MQITLKNYGINFTPVGDKNRSCKCNTSPKYFFNRKKLGYTSGGSRGHQCAMAPPKLMTLMTKKTGALSACSVIIRNRNTIYKYYNIKTYGNRLPTAARQAYTSFLDFFFCTSDTCIVFLILRFFGKYPAMDVYPLLPECHDSEVNFDWSRNF